MGTVVFFCLFVFLSDMSCSQRGRSTLDYLSQNARDLNEQPANGSVRFGYTVPAVVRVTNQVKCKCKLFQTLGNLNTL